MATFIMRFKDVGGDTFRKDCTKYFPVEVWPHMLLEV